MRTSTLVAETQRAVDVGRELDAVAANSNGMARLWLAIVGLTLVVAVQAACLFQVATRPASLIRGESTTLVHPTEVAP